MSEYPSIDSLSAERTAPQTLTLRNGRGAELKIGMEGAAGSFTPGELLQAAVAGCAALSAEAQLAHELGRDYEMSALMKSSVDEEADRLESITVTLRADMSDLDEPTRQKLITRAERVIERLCVVKRSVNHGVQATAEVVPS
ncbi:MAG TPA: OsmC family protein [Corynebacterium sp.]|nr:OsmC family protein [Corynebacterium sp.]